MPQVDHKDYDQISESVAEGQRFASSAKHELTTMPNVSQPTQPSSNDCSSHVLHSVFSPRSATGIAQRLEDWHGYFLLSASPRHRVSAVARAAATADARSAPPKGRSSWAARCMTCPVFR